jgi:hypothetical protein
VEAAYSGSNNHLNVDGKELVDTLLEFSDYLINYLVNNG